MFVGDERCESSCDGEWRTERISRQYYDGQFWLYFFKCHIIIVYVVYGICVNYVAWINLVPGLRCDFKNNFQKTDAMRILHLFIEITRLISE